MPCPPTPMKASVVRSFGGTLAARARVCWKTPVNAAVPAALPRNVRRDIPPPSCLTLRLGCAIADSPLGEFNLSHPLCDLQAKASIACSSGTVNAQRTGNPSPEHRVHPPKSRKGRQVIAVGETKRAHGHTHHLKQAPTGWQKAKGARTGDWHQVCEQGRFHPVRGSVLWNTQTVGSLRFTHGYLLTPLRGYRRDCFMLPAVTCRRPPDRLAHAPQEADECVKLCLSGRDSAPPHRLTAPTGLSILAPSARSVASVRYCSARGWSIRSLPDDQKTEVRIDRHKSGEQREEVDGEFCDSDRETRRGRSSGSACPPSTARHGR